MRVEGTCKWRRGSAPAACVSLALSNTQQRDVGNQTRNTKRSATQQPTQKSHHSASQITDQHMQRAGTLPSTLRVELLRVCAMEDRLACLAHHSTTASRGVCVCVCVCVCVTVPWPVDPSPVVVLDLPRFTVIGILETAPSVEGRAVAHSRSAAAARGPAIVFLRCGFARFWFG
jgi:hypothetical protein